MRLRACVAFSLGLLGCSGSDTEICAPDPCITYETTNPDECATLAIDCMEGFTYVENECGCGCREDVCE